MGAIGVVLLAVGAVLTFAVETSVSGVDLATVGVILMIVGAVAVIAAILQGSWFGMRARTQRTVSDDGRTVVEDSRTTRF